MPFAWSYFGEHLPDSGVVADIVVRRLVVERRELELARLHVGANSGARSHFVNAGIFPTR